MTLVVLVLIYSIVIAVIAWLVHRLGVAKRHTIFVSLLIFGIGAGILVVLLWPNDSSVLPNIFGVWLGDWIYHQAIAWVDDPDSAQAHNTIPWLFQIPQVYAIASVALCAAAGYVLQWINQRVTRTHNAGV